MPNATVRANARAMPFHRPAVPLSMRLRMEEAIERLIAVMDALDGDADLEDGHDAEPEIDEPSLGSTNHPNQEKAWCASYAGDDLEFEGDRVAQCDLEDGHDREDDPADSGIGDDDGYREQLVGEPSLGSTLDLDQTIAWGPDRLSGVFDGEASGTVDDLQSEFSYEARQADRLAAAAARDHARRLIRRQRVDAQA